MILVKSGSALPTPNYNPSPKSYWSMQALCKATISRLGKDLYVVSKQAPDASRCTLIHTAALARCSREQLISSTVKTAMTYLTHLTLLWPFGAKANRSSCKLACVSQVCHRRFNGLE